MTITEFKTACSAIEQEYKAKIAAAADLAAVEELRVAALGRKGALTDQRLERGAFGRVGRKNRFFCRQAN